MKNVWFMQDHNSMQVNEVFTTKKAVVAKVKKDFGQGRFRTVAKNSVYYYYTPDDKFEPICSIEKVLVIHNKRKRYYERNYKRENGTKRRPA